jgi:hypothetical protein
LRASASLRRPATARNAFQPIKKSFAPALSARFASTDASSAKEGKIHAVIGAVVDSAFMDFVAVVVVAKTFSSCGIGASSALKNWR